MSEPNVPPSESPVEFTRYAIVSARILRDGAAVCWLYREAPDDADDSGWRLLAGDESEEYLDDPRNARRVPLREVERLDEGLDGLLRAPVGSAFERGDGAEAFVPSEAPQPE